MKITRSTSCFTFCWLPLSQQLLLLFWSLTPMGAPWSLLVPGTSSLLIFWSIPLPGEGGWKSSFHLPHSHPNSQEASSTVPLHQPLRASPPPSLVCALQSSISAILAGHHQSLSTPWMKPPNCFSACSHSAGSHQGNKSNHVLMGSQWECKVSNHREMVRNALGLRPSGIQDEALLNLFNNL